MALGALGKRGGREGLDAGGVLGLLDGSKDEIAGALPADFARRSAAPASCRPPPRRPRPPRRARPRPAGRTPPPPPPPAKSGWTKWLLWLVVAALVLAPQRLFAPSPSRWSRPRRRARDDRCARRRPARTRAAPATAPAEPAPTDTAAVPANPLVVGGVDIGASVSAALASITATFTGITDAASAQAALPKLTEARDALSRPRGHRRRRSPEAGHAALKQMVTAALPAIQTGAERLKTDGADRRGRRTGGRRHPGQAHAFAA